MTLVALFAMTAGAWAEETTVYKSAVAISNLKQGDILAQGFSLTGSEIVYIVANRHKEDGTVGTHNKITSFDANTTYGENSSYIRNGVCYTPVDADGNDGNAWEVKEIVQGSPYIQGITYSVPGEMTLNAAKTVATMEMPGNDVTVDYELVRDLQAKDDAAFTFGGLPTGDGAIVKKDVDKYQFATAPTITLNDPLASNADIIGADGLTLSVYPCVEIMEGYWKIDETATPIPLADFLAAPQPGNWTIKATATTGLYDGTLNSPMITLVEAYDLTLRPAQSDKLQSVTVEGQAVTPDANGKIKNIEPAKKVKITTTGPDYIIRKATVKKKEKTYTITPRNMRVSYDYGNLTTEATLPYNTTTSELMKKVGLSSVNNSYNIQSVSLTSGSNVTLGTPTGTPGERGYEVPLTITGEGEFVLTVGRTNNNDDAIIKVIVSANSDN